MKAKLLHHTPLFYAANAARMSHDNHNKSDTDYLNRDVIGKKDYDLVRRVGFKMKHESTLEPIQYIWDCEFSTKTLLALSRHRIGISLTMLSTRYTTSKNKDKNKVQYTDDEKFNVYLDRIMDLVYEAIEDGYDDDYISLLLPQAYVYRGQITMNIRSFKHFLGLRLKKDAHFQIRELAQQMLDALPQTHSDLFKGVNDGR